jgi:hypothetical protein
MSTEIGLAPFEMKASSVKERTFEGLASPFGSIDYGGDTVVRGAYTKTLAEWRSSGRSLPWSTPTIIRAWSAHAWVS